MDPERLLYLWLITLYEVTVLALKIIWTVYLLTMIVIILMYINCNDIRGIEIIF